MATPAKDRVLKRRGIIRELSCELTDSELRQRGERLAALAIDRAEKNTNRKLVARELKAEVDRLDKEMAALSGEISNGRETRKVACEEWHNFTENAAEVVRTDTQKIIDTRVLEPHERHAQMSLIEGVEEPDEPALPEDQSLERVSDAEQETRVAEGEEPATQEHEDQERRELDAEARDVEVELEPGDESLMRSLPPATSARGRRRRAGD